MKVALGTFACSCIEARFGHDIASGLREILRSYAASLGSGSVPLPFPDFRRAEPPPDGLELDLCLAPEIEALLEQEARRQEVDLERLLTHVVFVYLVAAEEDGMSLRCGDDEIPR